MGIFAGPVVEAPISPDWQALLERFGLPIFMLVAILWTGASGVWVFRGTLDRADKAALEAEARADKAVREAEARSKTEAEENGRLRAQIDQMHREVLQREQQLSTGVASRIYDSALLYRERNELASTSGDRVDELGARLDELARRLESRGGAS